MPNSSVPTCLTPFTLFHSLVKGAFVGWYWINQAYSNDSVLPLGFSQASAFLSLLKHWSQFHFLFGFLRAAVSKWSRINGHFCAGSELTVGWTWARLTTLQGRLSVKDLVPGNDYLFDGLESGFVWLEVNFLLPQECPVTNSGVLMYEC